MYHLNERSISRCTWAALKHSCCKYFFSLTIQDLGSNSDLQICANISRRIKKSIKLSQDQKASILLFEYFVHIFTLWICFKIFLIFPYFPRTLSLNSFAISDKGFWQFTVFSHSFHSPQPKGNLISSITYFVYKLTFE